MNFFGLIYFMLTDNSENGKMLKKEVLFGNETDLHYNIFSTPIFVKNKK